MDIMIYLIIEYHWIFPTILICVILYNTLKGIKL